jgi:DNA adenine methylase
MRGHVAVGRVRNTARGSNARRQLRFDFCVAPEPFVKWAGGKRALLPQLIPLLPERAAFRRYHEPFAGGGAMFFYLQPESATLSDVNAQLVETYRCVQRDAESLIARLGELQRSHSTEHYYSVRSRYNASIGAHASLDRCADFVYLNRTCFNGLHRVNRRGEFNVPVGRYVDPRVVDAPALRATSRALQGVSLQHASFGSSLDSARPRDFVYFDPPYEPLPGRKCFTQYDAPFGPAEQDALADVYRELDRRGCKLMLSNSATPANRSRYRGYRIVEVLAPRSIGRDGSSRGPVTELVVINY